MAEKVNVGLSRGERRDSTIFRVKWVARQISLSDL